MPPATPSVPPVPPVAFLVLAVVSPPADVEIKLKYWALFCQVEYPDPPVPKPAPAAEKDATDDPLGLNPVRYGDWELKGIAVDF